MVVVSVLLPLTTLFPMLVDLFPLVSVSCFTSAPPTKVVSVILPLPSSLVSTLKSPIVVVVVVSPVIGLLTSVVVIPPLVITVVTSPVVGFVVTVLLNPSIHI